MLTSTIRIGAPGNAVVPVGILGQNLEILANTSQTLLSDRLRNAKFFGPAHADTGIAPEWHPRPTVTLAGMRCELTRGMGYSGGGSEAQFIATFRPNINAMGIQQNNVAIHAGEKLEVELWAKPWHRPVQVDVGLTAAPIRGQTYASATLNIDSGYWKAYRTVLEIPRTDADAVFYITIRGEGMLWLDQAHLRPVGEPLVSKVVFDALRSMQVPVVRFPGGSVTTIYEWRHGTGDPARRPTMPSPVQKTSISYDFGTDEFLDLCIDQQIIPHLTINIGTGTPTDAAEWLHYCTRRLAEAGRADAPLYVHIGNEQDMVHESAHMTGPMYIAALRDFVPPVRKVCPQARLIAVGAEKSPGLRPEHDTPWRSLILEQAADLVDVLSMQVYKGQMRDNPADQQLNAVESARKLADVPAKLIADIRASGRNLGAACTEWNYWLNCGPSVPLEPFTALHAFFTAAVLNHFTRMAPALELSNFYQIFGGLGYLNRHGQTLDGGSMARLFTLYRPAYPGVRVAIDVASAPLIGSDACVDAIAMHNEQGLWILIANRHPDQPSRLSWAGVDTASAECEMLAATDPFSHLLPRPWRPDEPMPPLSIARLRLAAV